MRRINDKRIPGRATGACMAVCMALLAVEAVAQQQAVPSAALLDEESETIPRYSVEMIIFEYAGSASDTTELFDPDIPADLFDQEFTVSESPQGPDTGMMPPERGFGEEPQVEPATPIDVPADELTRDDATDEPFVPLPGEDLELIPTYELKGVEFVPREDYQLTAAYDRLVTLDAYRPLVHTAWIQPTIEQEATEALELRRLGNPPLRLDGTVSVYLGRYLHVALDLALVDRQAPRPAMEPEQPRYYGDDRSSPPMGYQSTGFAPQIVYRIQEDRIVRNNETRYFDHPKFGVIARVIRIEDELTETMDTTGDLLPGINR